MRFRKVWDLPVRLFHWALVGVIVAAWATQETALVDMDLHALFGRAVIGLLVFRLVWGVIGSRTARFASFIKAPWHAITHLQELFARRPYQADGHNALGGWAVLALLGAVAVQAGTGLFTTDGILFEAPLASLVSYDMQAAITDFHKDWFGVLLAIIGLHVGAVILYRLLLGENLLRPMITGRKPIQGVSAEPDNEGATPLRFIISAAVGVIAGWAVGLG